MTIELKQEESFTINSEHVKLKQDDGRRNEKMGFMSLVFIGIYMVIMVIGAINLLTAFILFLVRFMKKKRNQKTGKASKVLAILFLVAGILAEIPLMIMVGYNVVDEVQEKKNFESLENKVPIGTDEFGDEFEYKGSKLVALDELENDSSFDSDRQKTVFVANLVTDHSDKDYIYAEMRKVENTSGYEIYMVYLSYPCYYVKKEDKEKVMDYYTSKAECIAEFQDNDSDDWLECEIDIQKIRDIAANSTTKEKRPVSAEKNSYDLEVNSVDYIWGASYSFCFFDDCVLFQPERHKKNVEGYLLSKEDEAYIREVFDNAVR